MSESVKYEFKGLILGDIGVGKTSILKYLYRADPDHVQKLWSTYRKTNLYTIDSMVEGSLVKIKIWDIAGPSLSPVKFGKIHCLTLVFDVTDMMSFEAMKNLHAEFLAEAKSSNPQKIPTVVLGNKVDLKRRQVSEEVAKAWCYSLNLEYIEISTKEGIMVEESIKFLAGIAIGKKMNSSAHVNEYRVPDFDKN